MKINKKVLFVGLGSIGKRHLSVLRKFCEIDALSLKSGCGRREKNFDKKYNVRSFDSLSGVLNEQPDFAVISNPTSHHFRIANTLMQAKIPFFIEKPISDNLYELKSLERAFQKTKTPILVGYNLRYHPLIIKAKSLIKKNAIGKTVSMVAEVGYSLKKWRPEVDYRESYSAQRKLGGGVIMDLSHEIDLALYFMGKAESFECHAMRLSDLDIDTEDTANILIKHKGRKLSSIHLDYIQSIYSRTVKFIGLKGNLVWDYAQGTLSLEQSKKRTKIWRVKKNYTRNDMYLEQMKHWIDILEKKKKWRVSFQNGIETSRLAIGCLRKAGLSTRSRRES